MQRNRHEIREFDHIRDVVHPERTFVLCVAQLDFPSGRHARRGDQLCAFPVQFDFPDVGRGDDWRGRNPRKIEPSRIQCLSLQA